MKALTVRQPWAWCIFHGKDVENRIWNKAYRGPLLIHAGKSMTPGENAECREFVEEEFGRSLPTGEELQYGCIVGKVNMIDCRKGYPSRWSAVGQFQWVFTAPVELPFIPCRGAQGLWDFDDYPRPDKDGAL